MTILEKNPVRPTNANGSHPPSPPAEPARGGGDGGGEPARPAVERAPDGQLFLVRPTGERVAVKVSRCFPWSEPTRYISLRDGDDKEALLVPDLSALDEASRRALEGAVAEAGFAFDVTRIVAMEEEFEIFHWVVETRQGERSFQTARDEWPRELPGGAYVLRDVAGDLYRVSEPEKMDEASQKIFWEMVD